MKKQRDQAKQEVDSLQTEVNELDKLYNEQDELLGKVQSGLKSDTRAVFVLFKKKLLSNL